MREISAKVIVAGAQGAGKSSLLRKYKFDRFECNNRLSTDVSSCKVEINHKGTKINLQLQDTAHTERFHNVSNMFWRGSKVAIVVYDITRYSSFEHMKQWTREIRAIQGNLS